MSQQKYIAGPILNKPHATTWQIWHIVDLIDRKKIDLDPEYQRDIVWSEWKMSHLIDSLLSNYYIPPLLFTMRNDPRKGNIRVCIDGKQRLTAIMKFMNNEIPRMNPMDGTKTWYEYDKKFPKRAYLTKEEQDLFGDIELVGVEYSDISESQEQELFSRVQLGVALTVAEKFQAYATATASFIHKLIEQYSTLGDVMETGRARPFQIIAIALLNISGPVEMIKSSGPYIDKFLKEDLTPSMKSNAQRVFAKYCEVVKADTAVFFENPRVKGRATKFAPAEFIMFAYLINRYPSRSVKQLIKDVRNMRWHVRNEYKDIRSNNVTFAYIKKWVDNDIDTPQEFEDMDDNALNENFLSTPHISSAAITSSHSQQQKRTILPAISTSSPSHPRPNTMQRNSQGNDVVMMDAPPTKKMKVDPSTYNHMSSSLSTPLVSSTFDSPSTTPRRKIITRKSRNGQRI